MRRDPLVLLTMLFASAAVAAGAQTETLSPLAVGVACAPPPFFANAPDNALRIIGSQDSVPRRRDVGVTGLPLSNVGEGIVIAVSNTMALTRVTRARDAVFSGDSVAVRR